MVKWSEVERVKRDGQDVVEEENGHNLVKIFRTRNGSKIRDSGDPMHPDESIPKDERKYRTGWKCEDCSIEFKSIKQAVTYQPCPE